MLTWQTGVNIDHSAMKNTTMNNSNQPTGRERAQKTMHTIIDPLVKFLIKIGLTPNGVTTIGFLLNLTVAVLFILGAERGERADLSVVGWGGFLMLIAGLFDMLDGQVARIGKMTSRFGAFYDSVMDRYSELVVFLGICWYLIAHGYFLSSVFAFVAVIGSVMVSYIRARAEAVGVECSGGFMQRPERVVLVGTAAWACGITSHYVGGDFKIDIDGLPFPIFETMTIFTLPVGIMGVLANHTAYQRLMTVRNSLLKMEKK